MRERLSGDCRPAALPSDDGAPEDSENPSPWASVELIRATILRLHCDWIDLPLAVRSRWWRRLSLGFLLVAALTAVIVGGARHFEAAGALDWDRPLLEWIVNSRGISFSTAMWLEGVGNGFVLWSVVLFAAGFAAWRHRPILTLAFLVGYSAIYPIIFFGWWLWDRDRPAIVLEGLADPGGFFRAFPSGHMVQASFAYGFLCFLWYRAARSTSERAFVGLAYLFILLFVGFGRLRIGAHWPSDIVAGTIIGIASLLAVVIAMGERHGRDNPEA